MWFSVTNSGYPLLAVGTAFTLFAFPTSLIWKILDNLVGINAKLWIITTDFLSSIQPSIELLL